MTSAVVRIWTSVAGTKTRAFPAHLVLLLASAAILLVAWSFIVPVFEAPDEPFHWAYARYVHDHSSLPVYSSALIEANQPPLYYYAIAPVAKDGDVPPLVIPNVNGVFWVSYPPNFFAEHPSDIGKYWPLRWARLITAVFSLLTVLFTYCGGYEATGSEYTGLLAGGLAAFLPQFTFRGTNISNDAMVATTSAAATYFIIRLIRREFAWRTGYAAAACVALAFLSKVSAIIFLPVLVAVLISGRVSWRERMKRFAVFLPAAILALPWLIRNEILYGDLLATKPMARTVPQLVHTKSIWSHYFFREFPVLVTKSFIGLFGWMNVYLPRSVYLAVGFLLLLGISGFIWSFLAGTLDKRLAIVLAVVPILSLASVVQLNLTFSQPQGRYLFPGLSALMILTAIGLERLPGWPRPLTYATLMLFAGLNLYALFGVEFPTYWVPRPSPKRAVGQAAIQPVRSADSFFTFGRIPH